MQIYFELLQIRLEGAVQCPVNSVHRLWSGQTTTLCQAAAYSQTSLGPAFPGGMFGAIEQGQEEAVKFYQAWKAQVIDSKNSSTGT